MKKSYISVVKKDDCTYPGAETLFRPSKAYPEYLFQDVSQETNEVYDSVREALHLLKLDESNFGTAKWNPLKDIVKPNDQVLIKPNLVMDVNHDRDGGVACLYTQPGVVAAVIDYVLIALGNTGRIVIGDAPMQECDFERLVRDSGYDKLVQYYTDKGYDVRMVDFRGLRSKVAGGLYHAATDDEIPAKIVHMDKASEFSAVSASDLNNVRVTNYDPRIMLEHHNAAIHEYFVSEYVLGADVIINMPKPKSHRKAGFTASLKNLVGINARKEFLPHHTKGAETDRGDEYQRTNLFHGLESSMLDRVNISSADGRYGRAWLYKQFGRVFRVLAGITGDGYSEGSWYGNHTISRTIADLNKIVFYADKNGVLQDHPVRRMFIVADMVIAGEKEGPVSPSPKEVGIIAAGSNPVCFDEVICTLMGFDMRKIPTLLCVRGIHEPYTIVDGDETPVIVSNTDLYNGKRPSELPGDALLHFIPTSGWKCHIEI